MEGLQVDLKRLFQGAAKWVLAAIAFLFVEAIVAYLARDLIGTLTGLTMLSFFLGVGFLTFALFLALILEPLEWLGKTLEPDGPTLDRRLDQVRNGFLFDIFEVVMEASAPTIGAKWAEFLESHPNSSEDQRNEFWDQLRADASKGLIETLDEEAVEDLSLATELLDLTRQIQSIQERARKQLRRFVYGLSRRRSHLRSNCFVSFHRSIDCRPLLCRVFSLGWLRLSRLWFSNPKTTLVA